MRPIRVQKSLYEYLCPWLSSSSYFHHLSPSGSVSTPQGSYWLFADSVGVDKSCICRRSQMARFLQMIQQKAEMPTSRMLTK